MTVKVTTDLAACHALRREVFIEEQGIAEHEEWDDLDDQAVQLLIHDDDTAVASARLLRAGAVGKIGRVCVTKSHRGKGLGADLVRFGLEHFRGIAGVSQVELGAQCYAIPFYEKLGFVAFGPVYDDAGIPHQDMRAAL
ncbi:MAG: GNAT family N-acetyltransferase [Pelagimonas sp.]|jgi:ElaA protein|nr:GNAT family N-acetyltransferase [Pelagimonas sp.]